MDNKFLGYVAFDASFPLDMALKSIMDFQNELAAEGYVTYVTYTAAGERVSDEVGLIFSTEPVTVEEAQEAFSEFLEEDNYDEEVDYEFIEEDSNA